MERTAINFGQIYSLGKGSLNMKKAKPQSRDVRYYR
jgi:hypothetical protein